MYATAITCFPHSTLTSEWTVRKTKGPTPVPSFHPSRRSFETTKEMMMSMIVEAVQDHCDAKQNVRVISCGFYCICELADQLLGFGSGWLSLPCLWILGLCIRTEKQRTEETISASDIHSLRSYL